MKAWCGRTPFNNNGGLLNPGRSVRRKSKSFRRTVQRVERQEIRRAAIAIWLLATL
jgi:hypothetical protein